MRVDRLSVTTLRMRRPDPVTKAAVGVLLLALIGGGALFALNRSGSAAPAAASVPPAASAIVPNSGLAPRVLWRRVKQVTARQTSGRVNFQLLQPYYAQPLELQVVAITDHRALETFANIEGQALRLRSTSDGVFAYISNQAIGVSRDAGGHWIRFTAGVDTWRHVNEELNATYDVRHLKFNGTPYRLAPRYRDHQLVVGIKGHLSGAKSHWTGTLWVSSKTLLPVQYVVRNHNVIRAQVDFSQWGQAPHVRTPKHWVDRALAPPQLLGG